MLQAVIAADDVVGAQIPAEASAASSAQPEMPVFGADSAQADQKSSSGGLWSWFGGGETQQKPVSTPKQHPSLSLATE